MLAHWKRRFTTVLIAAPFIALGCGGDFDTPSTWQCEELGSEPNLQQCRCDAKNALESDANVVANCKAYPCCFASPDECICLRSDFWGIATPDDCSLVGVVGTGSAYQSVTSCLSQ